MTEQLSYEVNLIDVVSAPSKRAADSLRALDRQAQKVQDSLDIKSSSKAFSQITKDAQKLRESMSFSKEIDRLNASLNKMKVDPKGYQMMIKSQRDLAAARRSAETPGGHGHGGGGGHGFMGGFTEGSGLGKHDNVSGAAFMGAFVAEAGFKIIEGLVDGIKEAINILKEGVKYAFEEAGKKEALNLGYKLSLGKEGGKSAMEDVERYSGRTGFDDDTILKMMLPLRNAHMSEAATRQAFATSADVASKEGDGTNAGKVGALMDDFKKIMLKGGVTDRLLLSMQVDEKAFYKEIAAQTHTDKDTAKKQAGEGKIDPQLLMNEITRQVNKSHGGAAGTGGEATGSTMEARLVHLQALPGEYLKQIVNSPAWTELENKFGEILEQLDPKSPSGKRITASLLGLFETVTGSVIKMLDPENIEKFVSGIETVIEKLQMVGHFFEVIGDAMAANARLYDGIGRVFSGKSAFVGFDGNKQGAAGDTYGGLATATNDIASAKTYSPDAVSATAKTYGVSEDNVRAMVKALRGAAPIHVETHVNVQGKVDESNAHTVGVSAGDAAAKSAERIMQEGGG